MKSSPIFLIVSLLFCHVAYAHHSTVAIYDSSKIGEVTGVVQSVSWRNPHGRIILEVEENNEIVEWRIETPSISVLRNSGVNSVDLKVGDLISIAGFTSRRDKPELAARNILLNSGQEIALMNSSPEPYFEAGKDGNLVVHGFDPEEIEAAIASADGLYRVWSTIMSDPAAFPMFKGGYPLTDEAQTIVNNFMPLDNDLLMCGTKGMPLIMISPLPIDFVKTGNDILMRIEEYDVRRVIHMGEDTPAPDEYSQFGFSRGHWEGRDLVVETDHIQAQYFDPEGTPQSEQMKTVERFMPNEKYDRLDYRITITDPAYFTEPFDLTRYFVWYPEMTVSPYECLERDFR